MYEIANVTASVAGNGSGELYGRAPESLAAESGAGLVGPAAAGT